MSTPANPYHRQLRLLVEVLPFVAKEECFGLKGGTAINLFFRDLPRYSVDIDLAYLPGDAYPAAMKAIEAALKRIAERLSSGSPSFHVALGKGEPEGPVDTLTVGDAAAEVKVEVNPVLRGTVHPAEEIEARARVQREFGFVAARVLSREDVYAGKLVAALDRQHPRDLFDVKLLMEDEGISHTLFKTFLAYLVGHKGSIPDVLAPRRKDISHLYHEQFVRMTVEPVPLEHLLDTRERLIREVLARLDEPLKRFLMSVQRRKPEWQLLGLDGVERLPAVKWRLLNLGKMPEAALNREIRRLEEVFEGRVR
jgi:predicted nucleotidyltransferase component of viral defense system